MSPLPEYVDSTQLPPLPNPPPDPPEPPPALGKALDTGFVTVTVLGGVGGRPGLAGMTRVYPERMSLFAMSCPYVGGDLRESDIHGAEGVALTGRPSLRRKVSLEKFCSTQLSGLAAAAFELIAARFVHVMSSSNW